MKRTFLSIVVLAIALVAHAAGFKGTTLADGGNYYLLNVYQQKFLSYGNTWGTQVSLDNSKPLLCTIAKSGTGYTINTHYSLTDNAYKEGVNNYMYVADGTIPVVNANYGDSDNSYTTRAAQVWSINEADGNYRIALSSNNNMVLAFSTGTACVMADITVGTTYTGDDGLEHTSTAIIEDKSLWKLVSEEEYNTYKAKKRFSVAALNVDGMPKSIKLLGIDAITLNPDAKEEAGATAIGQKMKKMGWDAIGLSEDFNYHSEIWNEAWNNGENNADGDSYNATTHAGDISVSSANLGNYVSKKPLFTTDGLCLFHRVRTVDHNTLTSTETRVKWNEHYGYTDNGADGLITKGYRFYVMKLTDGTEIDLYILHMDAETSDADNAARESQIIQLANAIKSSSNKRPIIVMGDTNCRYTRDRLKTCFIEALEADSRFTAVKDPWIEYGRDGIYPPCNGNAILASAEGYRRGEVVDKIFYINNTESDIRIEAETYCQDLSFINEAGEPLADHWPCVAEFSYHNYDPAIDDVVTENKGGTYYLRNRETGYYLKAGGWWGTHAVQGDYGSPMTLIQLADGKYSLQSNIGGLTQGEPYMDGSAAKWTMVEKDGYYSFTYDNSGTTMALTGNNPATFPHGPNRRYVTCANYNGIDKYQQWELLTTDDLRREMLQATSDNPFNCTHLLKGANFDASDNEGNGTWQGWPTSATRMTSNKCNGSVNIENGNPVAEVYVSDCSHLGSCSHETKWDINQTLSNIPNGTYKITCQAFQRISNSTSTTATINLYGKSGSTEKDQQVQLMYTGASVTDSNFGGKTQNGDYYYPNSMAEATLYFNAGYYNNEITIDVTDETLTLGIKKESKTGKDNTAWTCFDNFQIYYMAPAYGYNESRVDDADVISLTGKWSSNEQSELDNILKAKKYHAVKLTDATVTGALEIKDQNANTIIYANNASNVSTTQNVVVSGVCANFVLTDKADYAAPEGFSATNVTYKRGNTLNYNSVCMPFSYEASDLGTVYVLSNIDHSGEYDDLVFVEKQGTIDAGVPVLVKSTNEKWEISLKNKTVVGTAQNASADDGAQLHGAFIKKTIGKGYYKLSSDGTKFTNTIASSTVTPFRFYVAKGEGEVKELGLRISNDEETSLEEILQNPETKVTETYDLQGRKVLKVTTPGIYVRGGKKVMMK